MKPGTSPKTLRIPNDTIADIEREANTNNTTFSNIAIDRLRHKDNTLTPEVLSKIQTIINLSKNGEFKKAQEEENRLWAKISI